VSNIEQLLMQQQTLLREMKDLIGAITASLCPKLEATNQLVQTTQAEQTPKNRLSRDIHQLVSGEFFSPKKRNMFLFCFVPRFKLMAIANLEI
jgi:hypothetical protein